MPTLIDLNHARLSVGNNTINAADRQTCLGDIGCDNNFNRRRTFTGRMLLPLRQTTIERVNSRLRQDILWQ